MDYGGYIRNEEGIIYVVLGYPIQVKVLDFSYGYTGIVSYECSIVYIPDEYLNDESIDMIINNRYFIDFRNIKDNLFVGRRWIIEG
jgi:hypothetical protein